MYEYKGGEPKVIDFGLSKEQVSKETLMKCRVGTLQSMSPQVIKGQYTAKADIWSIGTIAYILLSGKHAFPMKQLTTKELMNQIVDGNMAPIKGPTWEGVSYQAKDFVKWLLTYDADKRPDANKVLSHEWLRKHSSSASHSRQLRAPERLGRIHNSLLLSTKSSVFEKLVAMMVAYKTPNESLTEYRLAFHDIDTTNRGSITYWQFRSSLQKSQCKLSESDMKEIFQSIDVENTGVINYTQFLAMALLANGRFEEDQIAAAFEKLDVDRDGFVSKQDICSVLGGHCNAADCARLTQEVVERYDGANDGT